MLKERKLQLSNIGLSALEYGNESEAQAALIFIHGWLDNAASFTTTIESICQKAEASNWYFLSLDLPGHGLSQHRNQDNYYPFHDYISELHELLAQIEVKNLILVGHSLGALIASCYSAAFPEKVQGVILIEGLGPLTESAEKSVQRLRKGVLSRQRILAKPIRRYATRHDACLHRMHANQLSEYQLKP
ncbi:alpha/beta fold hydrolase, partial [Vibrio casei]